eukprot:gene10818-4984_t
MPVKLSGNFLTVYRAFDFLARAEAWCHVKVTPREPKISQCCWPLTLENTLSRAAILTAMGDAVLVAPEASSITPKVLKDASKESVQSVLKTKYCTLTMDALPCDSLVNDEDVKDLISNIRLAVGLTTKSG